MLLASGPEDAFAEVSNSHMQRPHTTHSLTAKRARATDSKTHLASTASTHKGLRTRRTYVGDTPTLPVLGLKAPKRNTGAVAERDRRVVGSTWSGRTRMRGRSVSASVGELQRTCLWSQAVSQAGHAAPLLRDSYVTLPFPFAPSGVPQPSKYAEPLILSATLKNTGLDIAR
eukprot:1160748-Pelagomonas_calceolata.AAC.7